MSAHRPTIRLGLAIAMMALLAVACGDDEGATTTIGQLTTTSGTGPALTVEVESLTLGVPHEGRIDATADPYPANAIYFSVEVPAGVSALVLTLTNLEADLDLYVGYGSLDSVQGLDAGSWDWAGQEFGTAPEHIEIANPEAGTYYIEVFDYDRAGSTYTLLATTD